MIRIPMWWFGAVSLDWLEAHAQVPSQQPVLFWNGLGGASAVSHRSVADSFQGLRQWRTSQEGLTAANTWLRLHGDGDGRDMQPPWTESPTSTAFPTCSTPSSKRSMKCPACGCSKQSISTASLSVCWENASIYCPKLPSLPVEIAETKNPPLLTGWCVWGFVGRSIATTTPPAFPLRVLYCFQPRVLDIRLPDKIILTSKYFRPSLHPVFLLREQNCFRLASIIKSHKS